MRLSTSLAVLSLGVVSVFGFGCARNTPPAETPEQTEVSPAPESAPASETSDASAANAHTLDVGMEFKEKDETEQRRASHDAPPTGAWKPVEKDKTIDSKGTSK